MIVYLIVNVQYNHCFVTAQVNRCRSDWENLTTFTLVSTLGFAYEKFTLMILKQKLVEGLTECTK
jgi:hypothetical protein